MLSVFLDCFCFIFLRLVYPNNIGYTRRRKTNQKQSRETDNIGYTRGRKTKQKQSRETDNIRYTRRRKTKQKQSRETDIIGYTRDCFCFVYLCLVYPMLSVSLDCFCFVFFRLVYHMLSVSLDCFWFVSIVYGLLCHWSRGNTFKKSPPWHSWTSNCICKHQMFTGSKTDLLKVGSLFIYSTGYKTREKKLFLNLIVHVHWSRGGHYLF
jgi:hypothetical protein